MIAFHSSGSAPLRTYTPVRRCPLASDLSPSGELQPLCRTGTLECDCLNLFWQITFGNLTSIGVIDSALVAAGHPRRLINDSLPTQPALAPTSKELEDLPLALF